MIEFFKIILYEPLLNILIFFYNIIPGHDLGLAIVFLTLLLKLILFPLSRKSIKAQKSLKDLQPKMEEIKKKYADQKEKQAQMMMQLYKEHKVSPFSSCYNLHVYSFLQNPGTLKVIAFGFLNLAKPSPVLAGITGVLQYLQMKFFTTQKPDSEIAKQPGAKDENMMTAMNKQMKFMMPFLTVFIGLTLPSGLMLYWLVSSLFTIFEQKLVAKQKQE